jgi:DNA-binding NtrC family response regulator
MVELTGLSVLIVEDEPIIALDLASMLKEAGATVVGPAMTLVEAEALSAREQFHVALLDVRIGNETITPVAAQLAGRGVPLIFHTGHGNADSLIGRWPHSRVLHKPVRPSELLAILSSFAGEERKRRRLTSRSRQRLRTIALPRRVMSETLWQSSDRRLVQRRPSPQNLKQGRPRPALPAPRSPLCRIFLADNIIFTVTSCLGCMR